MITTQTVFSYALIELGQAAEQFIAGNTQHLRKNPHIYLFDDTPEAEISSIGPLLVCIDGASTRLTNQLRSWKTAHPSAISSIESLLNLEALADHLRARLTVKLPNGDLRLFRFYDPVTLAVLHAQLDNVQHKNFWEPILRWKFAEGNEGHITLTGTRPPMPERESDDHRPPAPENSQAPGHFRLSQFVWDQLRLEADLRQVRALITKNPEFAWFSQLSKDDQDAVYSEIVDLPLRESGIYSTPDLYTVAKIQLRYPLIDFMEINGMPEAVAQAKKEEGSLDSALIEHVRPETWTALNEGT